MTQSTLRVLPRLCALWVCLVLLAGCGSVRSFEKDKLADPIMEREDHFAKQTLEQKFFTTREGSIGGAGGIGGGCGCAK